MTTTTTMKMLEAPVPFKFTEHNVHILIIGAGGTGGHLYPNVARVANQLNREGLRDVKITLVDGDTVEEKNVNRQNFFYPDINKNKAELLATRHSRLFGMELASITQYLENEEDLEKAIFAYDGYFPIVVSCVDNHKSRQLIHQVYKKYPERMIWIDSGNKKYSGQVVVGYESNVVVQPDGTISKRHATRFKLPAVTEVFPEILTAESQFNSEISCDDHAVENIQNIGANVLSSTQQFIMINQLIAGEGELTTFMVRFDATSGTCASSPTTHGAISEYLNK